MQNSSITPVVVDNTKRLLWKRVVFGILFLIAASVFLFLYVKSDTGSFFDSMAHSVNYAVNSTPALTVERFAENREGMSPEVVRNIASTLKAIGFKLYGGNYCGATIRQLDVFKVDREAERIVNEMYVECTREGADCSGIKSLPTWKVADNKYPGMRVSKDDLIALIYMGASAYKGTQIFGPGEPSDVVNQNLRQKRDDYSAPAYVGDEKQFGVRIEEINPEEPPPPLEITVNASENVRGVADLGKRALDEPPNPLILPDETIVINTNPDPVEPSFVKPQNKNTGKKKTKKDPNAATFSEQDVKGGSVQINVESGGFANE